MALLHVDGDGQLLWQRTIISAVTDTWIADILVDRDDSVLLSGQFTGQLDWGGTPLTATTEMGRFGYADLFLVRQTD